MTKASRLVVQNYRKVILLLLVISLYFVASGLIVGRLVQPMRSQTDAAPPDPGFADAERVSFDSGDDVRLEGFFLPSSGDRAIVLVHGIHSQGWGGQAPDLARALSDAGFHVLVFDLRGHGRSGGEARGLGLKEGWDVAAAIGALIERGFDAGKIGVHGTSYGAAAALLATASAPEVGAVVADSAFADIRDVAGGEIQRQTGLPTWDVDALMPGLGMMAHRIYSLDFDDASPERALAGIPPRPILLIHGAADPVTPVEHAKRLKAAAPTAALWILPGRRHTEGIRLAPDYRENSPLREAYLERVIAFFERAL